ncbi:hypothetical protein B0H14DRAFT_3433806 [Mycena olivaceomarginata]|nr:hypothetical protein B0H14DRAFT_3433806 [Mycena olivaceomarginata]
MSGPMDTLPQEMWLRVFELVDCTTSLRCVVLVCRKFHNLGIEALVRHISWPSTAVAMSHLDFWDRNPSKTHLVRSVYFSLSGTDVTKDYPRIFGCIQSFSKLKHIELGFGPLPEILYPTLQYLPSVTHLTLESCAIPPPPLFFPYSYPSPSADPPLPIQVTHLSISKLWGSIANLVVDGVSVPIAHHLPNLRAFSTDAIGFQIPVDVSAQLSSLSITLPTLSGDIQPRLDAVLQRSPALTHLDISIAPAAFNHALPPPATPSIATQPSPPLPELRVLSAPWPTAGHIIRGAPLLTHLRVGPQIPIPKTSDAIWLIERIRHAPLRGVALHLQGWDDEVLLAATRCLPGCEVLEMWYHDAGPSDTFLFNLGIHHLPLLPALHTLRLVALPPLPAPPLPPRFMWEHAPTPTLALPAPGMPLMLPGPAHPAADDDSDDDMSGAQADGDTEADAEKAARTEAEKAADEEAEREATAALRECVHAWARYNPVLRRVQLGSGAGRTWVRQFTRGRGGGRNGGKGVGRGAGSAWETDVEDEERRAEAWARECEE